MKKLLFVLLVFSAFSCGKKRNITAQGETLMDGRRIQWETYTERDSFFKTYTENGKLLSITAAPSEKVYNDSTFSEKDFAPEGQLIQVKSFRKGRPDKEWISYYADGKKKSYSLTQNGVLMKYSAWYADGKTQVEAMRQPDGKMERKEYLGNGNLIQEFQTDSLGNGHCSTYYMNGTKSGEGELYRFTPIGFWKRFDTLGNPQPDTLIGVILKK